MPTAGSLINDIGGEGYRLEFEIKRGGQATVWRAVRLSDGHPMAIKLFFGRPSASQRQDQIDRLNRVIEKAAQIAESLPAAQVCFPRAVISSADEFGVAMDLAIGEELTVLIDAGPHDQRDKYVSKGLYSVLSGRLKHWHFLLAAFHLARAVNVIHRHAMTHCDLSLGNVFIEADTGKICVIDCDNLACGEFLRPTGVRGTPGFRAPELIRNEKEPLCAQTDTHSLAVLIFQLVMLRHPLIGCNTPNPNPWNDPDAEFAAFGSRAIFTDHPRNATNRFTGGLPFDALPRNLRELFYDAFVEGLDNATKRPSAIRLARGLWQSLECMTECTTCRQRFFLTDKDGTCLFCQASNRRPRWWFVFNDGTRMLVESHRKLYEHHLGSKEFSFQMPFAELRVHDNDMVAKNVGSEAWSVSLNNGTVVSCPPTKAFRFTGVKSVAFGKVRSAQIHRV